MKDERHISNLFFFQESGAHRDLHSFPTRRSSDLGRFEEDVVAKKPAVVVIVAGVNDVYQGRSQPPRASSDRKSTRLNSSHVSISYAVFCLKKKKKQKDSISI